MQEFDFTVSGRTLAMGGIEPDIFLILVPVGRDVFTVRS